MKSKKKKRAASNFSYYWSFEILVVLWGNDCESLIKGLESQDFWNEVWKLRNCAANVSSVIF